MQVSTIVLISVLSIVSVLSISSSASISGSSENMIRPTRPKLFTSPDELRDYLSQLGNFYAIAGRPRFGKRTLYPWMAAYAHPDSETNNRLPISNIELLQILSSMTQNQD